MLKSLLRKLSHLMLLTIVLGTAGNGFAQDVAIPDNACVGLDQNERWQILFSEFSEEYALERYENASLKIDELREICASSPLINYSAGMTYAALNQREKARHAYLEAIKNTQYFVVDDNFYRKMLDTYYRYEHSDEICDKKDLIQCQTEKEAAHAQIQTLNTRLSQSVEGIVLDELKARELNKYGAILWTGTGVSIAGLGTLLAGLHFLFQPNKITHLQLDGDSTLDMTFERSPYLAHYMVGIGGALLVGGLIMTGIGGYHYTHTIADDVTMSWHVGANHLQFDMTF